MNVLKTLAALAFFALLWGCKSPTGNDQPKPEPLRVTTATATVRGGNVEWTLAANKSAQWALSYGKGGQCDKQLGSDVRSLSRLDLAAQYVVCYTATLGSESASGRMSFSTEDPCVADLSRFERAEIEFRHRPAVARFFVTLAPVQYALLCGNSYKMISGPAEIIESIDGGRTYARRFSVPIGARIGVQYRRTVGGNNDDGGWLTGNEMYFFPTGDSTAVTTPVTKTSYTVKNGCAPPNPCSVDGLWELKVEPQAQALVVRAP